MMLGVPIVAMPFINDQISNAKRIVELGIGKKIRSFPSSSKELYCTAISVLKDKGIRERSRELQNTLKADMSLERIIKEIERLVGSFGI